MSNLPVVQGEPLSSLAPACLEFDPVRRCKATKWSSRSPMSARRTNPPTGTLQVVGQAMRFESRRDNPRLDRSVHRCECLAKVHRIWDKKAGHLLVSRSSALGRKNPMLRSVPNHGLQVVEGTVDGQQTLQPDGLLSLHPPIGQPS